MFFKLISLLRSRYSITLFSLLILVASLIASYHQIEHLDPTHDESSCLVCVFQDNFNSDDLINTDLVSYVSYQAPLVCVTLLTYHTTLYSPNLSRAPPPLF